MPTFAQFFSFDANQYRAEISKLNDDELRNLERQTDRKRMGAGAQVAAGVGTVHLTGGISLLSVPLSARALQVESKKLKVLREELEARHLQRQNRRMWDIVEPIATNLTAAVIGGGIVCAEVDAATSPVAAEVLEAAATVVAALPDDLDAPSAKPEPTQPASYDERQPGHHEHGNRQHTSQKHDSHAHAEHKRTSSKHDRHKCGSQKHARRKHANRKYDSETDESDSETDCSSDDESLSEEDNNASKASDASDSESEKKGRVSHRRKRATKSNTKNQSKTHRSEKHSEKRHHSRC